MDNLIGIAGGIGSGKSVVSRVLRLKGFSVYDCDSRAKVLMKSDPVIKQRIRDELSEAVTDGTREPDRALLASIVFSDEGARKRLNEIVHGAVIRDLLRQLSGLVEGKLFVESAIIAESGIADLCKEIWVVRAENDDERIRRIIERDGIDSDKAEERIRAQRQEEKMLESYCHKCLEVKNTPDSSLLLQIETLLDGSIRKI